MYNNKCDSLATMKTDKFLEFQINFLDKFCKYKLLSSHSISEYYRIQKSYYIKY